MLENLGHLFQRHLQETIHTSKADKGEDMDHNPMMGMIRFNTEIHIGEVMAPPILVAMVLTITIMGVGGSRTVGIMVGILIEVLMAEMFMCSHRDLVLGALWDPHRVVLPRLFLHQWQCDLMATLWFTLVRCL